jgi:hypothetical protein
VVAEGARATSNEPAVPVAALHVPATSHDAAAPDGGATLQWKASVSVGAQARSSSTPSVSASRSSLVCAG